MLFLKEILMLFELHVYSISFLTGILNEEAVLFLIILAEQGDAQVLAVVLFGFLGMMFHDTMLFFIGTSKIMKRLGERLTHSSNNQKLLQFVEKWGQNNLFLMLTFARFIYGIRTPMVVYVAHKRPHLGRFTLLNLLSMLIWCAVMMPLAWLAGRGFSQFLMIFRGAEKIIGVVIITALLIYVVQSFIKNYVLKKQQQVLIHSFPKI